VIGIINPDRPDQMVLYNDIKNSSVTVPSPVAVGSFLRESFDSTVSYVSSAIDSVAANPYVRSLMTAIKVVNEDLNAQPARHAPATPHIDFGPFNVIDGPVAPYRFKNGALDAAGRVVFEGVNHGINFVNWVSNIGGYTLEPVLVGLDTAYTGLDNLSIAKTGNSLNDWDAIAQTTYFKFDDVLLGGLVAIGRVSGNVAAALRVETRIDDAVMGTTKIIPSNIKVIGRLEDTAVAKRWSGHDVLDIPKWSIDQNMQWVDEGIANKQTFYLASPEAGNMIHTSGKFSGHPTVYAQELERIRNAGYVKIGDYYVHPDNVNTF
jgi:hypothetical protein